MDIQGSPGLESTPVEIVEHITTFISLQDLRALRICCRDVASKTSRVFATRYFEKAAVVLSNEDGLGKMLDVVQHESFSSAIKKHVLCVDNVRRQRMIDGPYDVLGCRKSVEYFLEHMQTVTASNIYCERHEWMCESGKRLEYLVEIFRRLTRTRNPVKIVITDQEEAKMIAWGNQALQIASGSNEWLWATAADATRAVLHALSISGMPLHSLSMCRTNRAEHSWSMYSLTESYGKTMQTKRLFQNLRHLGLHTDSVDEEAKEVTERQVLDLVGIIATLPHLESLSICFARDEEDYDFAIMPDSCFTQGLLHTTIPTLKHLRLVGMRLDFSSLRGFLRRHTTLEDATLIDSLIRSVRYKSRCGISLLCYATSLLEDGDEKERKTKVMGLCCCALHECDRVFSSSQSRVAEGETETEEE